MTIDKRKLAALKGKRDGLMIRYRHSPVDSRLAMEIQSLTDEIARLENPPDLEPLASDPQS